MVGEMAAAQVVQTESFYINQDFIGTIESEASISRGISRRSAAQSSPGLAKNIKKFTVPLDEPRGAKAPRWCRSHVN